MSAFASAVILTGPTAGGKSALALELAEALGGEIVAADSMTLYRSLDVGTAKPTAAERARVPHHLIDVLDPHESASVAWWLDRAAATCADIAGRGKLPILVGGTPLYLKAVFHGLFDAPPADHALRARLEAEDRFELHKRLNEVDPTAAARLHPNDVRRVVRALEVFALTGRPITAFQDGWDRPPANVPCVVLDRPRDELHQRIEARVAAMLDAGWLDECRRFQAIPLGREAAQAIGYAELFAFLRGEAGWDETTFRIVARTRQLAKRQLTWFRGLAGVRWVPAGPDAADRVRSAWAESHSCPAES